GPRHRHFDMHPDSKSGTPSEDDEKSNTTSISRNGGYRNFKPSIENSVDDDVQLTEKSRDAWQYGIQKKQSTSGVLGKRDS
ncbi:P-loop containing nucleoside triphosphate hydrolases superfamily protein, partial [Thalictrum thalictroides]